MIVAKRKPFDEILRMIAGHRKVLVAGCGTCVAVCLAGGEKEVAVLAAEIDMARRLKNEPIEIGQTTLERQCDREYLAQLDGRAEAYEAIVSLACGVGIQFLAERFPKIPVYPGVDTCGLAVNQDVGWYEERCRSCGRCVLDRTAGICPVTLCAKGLYNGPCGGTNRGSCEIDPEQPCAWYAIHERLKGQGRLDCIRAITPAQEWRDTMPRTLIQPGYRKPEKAKA